MSLVSFFRSSAITVLVLCALQNLAQTIDPTFIPGNQAVSQIGVQSTGKIIVVNSFMESYNGNPAKGIARLNPDGSFDPTFFSTGSGFLNSGFAYDRHLLIDNSDRIIVVGQFTSVHGVPRTDIVRFNSDGTVDNFNPRIHVDGPITRALINTSDNKIYISGAFTSYDGVPLSGIARLNPDGSLDTGFNPTTPNYGILAVQNDGKPIALGGPGGVVFTRFNIDGSIDPSFTPALLPPFITIFEGGLGNIAKISPDNKIYFTWLQSIGEGMYPSRLSRYNADGTEDTGFVPAISTGGFGSIEGISVDDSGKIIVAGMIITAGSNNGIFRLNLDGSVDSAFISPLTSPYAADAILQPDGNLVLAASFPDGTSLRRLLLPQLSIQSFTPTEGVAGTPVTISGTEFSTSPTNNIIKFNGTEAIVTSSTTTSITTTVPAGATTGTITVILGTKTVTSADAFTVIPPVDKLWGMTKAGGTSNEGTIFSIKTDGTTYQKHFDFSFSNGVYPSGGLTNGTDGNFYGMANQGGASGIGTIFKISPGGSFTKLADMDGFTLGGGATGNLTEGPDGFFYGMSTYDWTLGCGVIFKISSSGALTQLHVFNGTTGCSPYGSLTLGSDGDFYGLTKEGGANGFGTIFKITSTGSFTKIHDFQNFSNAYGGLVQGSDGDFYGVTFEGNIFKITSSGTYTSLYSLTWLDGYYPLGTLALGVDGDLYGMCSEGGDWGNGTIFKITTTGTFTKLHDMNYITDGGYPQGELRQATDGNFYGTAKVGGAFNAGTVFRISTTGAFTKIRDFEGQPDGNGPDLNSVLALPTYVPVYPFSTTWTTFDGTITIPTTGSGYNYNISWKNIINAGLGDGTASGVTGDYTITGLSIGDIYEVNISGMFPRIFFNASGDKDKINTIERWGSIAWTSMASAFHGCGNLTYNAIDVPDLSAVSDMSYMFAQAYNFNGNLNNWDVSNVTNMSFMFNEAVNFNQPLDLWNVGNVTDMSHMFFYASIFNQPLNSWSVNNVQNMSGIFSYAGAFNQPLNSWNVGNVTDMSNMFFLASNFNQPLNNWDVSNVRNMSFTFGYAENFNQPLDTWNVGNVWYMYGMFYRASSFNQDIGNWDVSSVSDMGEMFNNSASFNQDISNWDVRNVTNMSFMFIAASAFNRNIGTWSLNSSVNMFSMLNNSGMDCNNYSATLIGWSANPSTPNGRSLGATGRQYGTNGVAARTSLTTAKGWTITGDSPSGVACGSVTVPTITNFTPSSGPIGTTVTITGTNFDPVAANNDVKFNGVSATTPSAASLTNLTIIVPNGATTGTISVTTPDGTGLSNTDFTVTCVPPPAPTGNSAPRCGSGTINLTATGATGTQEYRWYDAASGGSSLSSTSTFTTPTLTLTTSYYVSVFDIATSCESSRTQIDAIVNTPPAAPSAISNSGCSGTSISIVASGGTNGQYRWYTAASGGTPDTQQNATFNTPALTNTTSFWVAINNGTCESARTEVIGTVLPLPTSPIVQPVNPVCPGSEITLTATGGADGQYRWYDGATIMSGEVNSTLAVANLTSAKTFSASIHDGTCESNKTSVVASIKSCTAPSVESTVATAFLNGIVAINLENLISDPEGDLDPASLQIIEQPQSGASATLEGFNLTIDYSGIAFSGTDRVTLGICDLTNLCTEQAVTIELGGAIKIYNAVSPNGDGKNEIFFIQYIDVLPETQRNTVSIYNRWGDEVFQTKNYNNTSNVFKGESNTGDKLPSGTYFYKIIFASGKSRTGFLELKR